MIIGTLVVEAYFYNSHSLKDKRSILQSITKKIKQRFNVSIVESDHQDLWQRTEWTMVSVGTSRTQVEKEIQKALFIIDNHPNLEVTRVHWEWL